MKKSTYLWIGLVLLALLFAAWSLPRFNSRMATERIQFTEPAHGGVLTMTDSYFCQRGPYLSILTKPGESASSVTKRLIAEGDRARASSMEFRVRQARVGLRPVLEVLGTKSRIFFGGTETGLGIPKAPHSCPPPMMASNEPFACSGSTRQNDTTIS